jgi:lipopolysaccharide biosynthesis regulator YciM
MKRALLLAGVIVLVAAVGLLIALNPGDVEFHPDHVHSFRPPLGLLLIGTFLIGVVAVLLGSSLRHVGGLLGNWRARRGARQAAQAGAWHQAGEQLAWGGDLERSRALLRKAWKRHPGNGNAALALGSSYLDTGEYGAAQAVLEAAVAVHANDPDLRYALGETLRRGGDSAAAIRMLETVRVQHPRAPRVLISLREVYRAAARWTEAAEVQEAYLTALPAGLHAGERDLLAQLRYQAALSMTEPDARLAALDASVRMDRTFVPALVSLGDALLACGRADEAKKLWEKAFRGTPRLIFIERLLAAADSPRQRERALAMLGKQSDQVDQDSVRLLLARSALNDGAVDRAEAHLAAIGKPDTPTVQRCWAELHHQRGDHAAAWTALSKAADGLGAAAADHHCIVCGRTSEAWTGYCAGCERWDTYRSGTENT